MRGLVEGTEDCRIEEFAVFVGRVDKNKFQMFDFVLYVDNSLEKTVRVSGHLRV